MEHTTERAFSAGDFFEDGAFANVTIKFDGRELKAHKMILCTRLTYLNKHISREDSR